MYARCEIKDVQHEAGKGTTKQNKAMRHRENRTRKEVVIVLVRL